MCGNSICQDRRFLAREMPELERSSTTAISTSARSRSWRAAGRRRLLAGFQKSSTHLALDDIRDSIRELAHYRTTFLRVP